MCEPVTDADAYLAGLNLNFPNWGGLERFDWVMRPFAGERPEIFGSYTNGELKAGSIISYRVVSDGVRQFLVGIMTASWTHPQQRGRGNFTRFVSHSAELARRRGASALLAFVTADNASRRRLEAAGSELTPTWYIGTPASSSLGEQWSAVEATPNTLRALDECRRVAAGEQLRFVYPSLADLDRQMLGRSAETSLMVAESGEIAIVEDVGATLRILASSRASAVPATRSADEIFSFTASPTVAAVAHDAGARVTDGFLTALPLATGWPSQPSWFIESGDRI